MISRVLKGRIKSNFYPIITSITNGMKFFIVLVFEGLLLRMFGATIAQNPANRITKTLHKSPSDTLQSPCATKRLDRRAPMDLLSSYSPSPTLPEAASLLDDATDLNLDISPGLMPPRYNGENTNCKVSGEERVHSLDEEKTIDVSSQDSFVSPEWKSGFPLPISGGPPNSNEPRGLSFQAASEDTLNSEPTRTRSGFMNVHEELPDSQLKGINQKVQKNPESASNTSSSQLENSLQEGRVKDLVNFFEFMITSSQLNGNLVEKARAVKKFIASLREYSQYFGLGSWRKLLSWRKSPTLHRNSIQDSAEPGNIQLTAYPYNILELLENTLMTPNNEQPLPGYLQKTDSKYGNQLGPRKRLTKVPTQNKSMPPIIEKEIIYMLRDKPEDANSDMGGTKHPKVLVAEPGSINPEGFITSENIHSASSVASPSSENLQMESARFEKNEKAYPSVPVEAKEMDANKQTIGFFISPAEKIVDALSPHEEKNYFSGPEIGMDVGEKHELSSHAHESDVFYDTPSELKVPEPEYLSGVEKDSEGKKGTHQEETTRILTCQREGNHEQSPDEVPHSFTNQKELTSVVQSADLPKPSQQELDQRLTKIKPETDPNASDASLSRPENYIPIKPPHDIPGVVGNSPEAFHQTMETSQGPKEENLSIQASTEATEELSPRFPLLSEVEEEDSQLESHDEAGPQKEINLVEGSPLNLKRQLQESSLEHITGSISRKSAQSNPEAALSHAEGKLSPKASTDEVTVQGRLAKIALAGRNKNPDWEVSRAGEDSPPSSPSFPSFPSSASSSFLKGILKGNRKSRLGSQKSLARVQFQSPEPENKGFFSSLSKSTGKRDQSAGFSSSKLSETDDDDDLDSSSSHPSSEAQLGTQDIPSSNQRAERKRNQSANSAPSSPRRSIQAALLKQATLKSVSITSARLKFQAPEFSPSENAIIKQEALHTSKPHMYSLSDGEGIHKSSRRLRHTVSCTGVGAAGKKQNDGGGATKDPTTVRRAGEVKTGFESRLRPEQKERDKLLAKAYIKKCALANDPRTSARRRRVPYYRKKENMIRERENPRNIPGNEELEDPKSKASGLPKNKEILPKVPKIPKREGRIKNFFRGFHQAKTRKNLLLLLQQPAIKIIPLVYPTLPWTPTIILATRADTVALPALNIKLSLNN